MNFRGSYRMANININNLSGSDLFNDSESFLTEINDEINDEINEIAGGLSHVTNLGSAAAGLRTWQCAGSDLWVGPPVVIKNMSA
jgi:hypothetical protein